MLPNLLCNDYVAKPHPTQGVYNALNQVMICLSSVKDWLVDVLWPSNPILTIKQPLQMSKPIRKLIGRLRRRWIGRLVRNCEPQSTKTKTKGARTTGAPTKSTRGGAAETSRSRKHKRRHADRRSKHHAERRSDAQLGAAPQDHERKLP
ncbi:MAG: hypothetical protein ACKER6_01150 [Candidatus Hodgkinia cicadicola]